MKTSVVIVLTLLCILIHSTAGCGGNSGNSGTGCMLPGCSTPGSIPMQSPYQVENENEDEVGDANGRNFLDWLMKVWSNEQ